MLSPSVSTRLDRQQLGQVFKDPRALLAFEQALKTVQDTPAAVEQAQADATLALANAATAEADAAAAQTTANTALGNNIATQAELDALEATLGTLSTLNVSSIRGQIAGLTLSAAGGTGTYGIAAGSAADSTATVSILQASARTKTTSAWAVGSGNGALDTGAIANNTTYAAYKILRPDTGVVDDAISLSAVAPTFGANIPVAYTRFRRIGLMKTDGSGQLVKFSQDGDEFLWDAPVAVMNATATSATAALVSAQVPAGVKLRAMLMGNLTNAAAATPEISLFTSPDVSVQVANAPGGNGQLSAKTSAQFASGSFQVRTDVSGQVRVVSLGANGTLFIVCQGWIDTRGRND